MTKLTQTQRDLAARFQEVEAELAAQEAPALKKVSGAEAAAILAGAAGNGERVTLLVDADEAVIAHHQAAVDDGLIELHELPCETSDPQL